MKAKTTLSFRAPASNGCASLIPSVYLGTIWKKKKRGLEMVQPQLRLCSGTYQMIVEILEFKNKGFFNVNTLFVHIYEVQRHIVVVVQKEISVHAWQTEHSSTELSLWRLQLWVGERKVSLTSEEMIVFKCQLKQRPTGNSQRGLRVRKVLLDVAPGTLPET